jgi:DNA-binding transcriptional MerR regulator
VKGKTFEPLFGKVRAALERSISARALGIAATHGPCCAGSRFSVFAQRIGLTLEEIGAELAKLPADRIPTRGNWARLSGKWTKRIDQRIAELKRLRAGLTQCIGCGCLSIDKCEACEPSRPSRTQGAGSALLAWLKPADRKLTHDLPGSNDPRA